MYYIIEILDGHPFWDPYAFSIEMLWSTYASAQESPIDSMIKWDN